MLLSYSIAVFNGHVQGIFDYSFFFFQTNLELALIISTMLNSSA